MKDRLRDHLSEVGESFDYLRSDVRNLSRYMAELEELIEGYRTFAATATLSTPADQQVRRKLLKRTQKIIGSPPDAPVQEAEKPAPGDEMREEIPHSSRQVLTRAQERWYISLQRQKEPE
jgi:hypothetical protein